MLVFLAVLVMVIIAKTAIVVPQQSMFVVERLGRYAGTLEAGFHILCDKPMTRTLEEARTLVRVVREQDVIFALTHNYTGYPMVRQARAMVADGLLASLDRAVIAEKHGLEVIEDNAQGIDGRGDTFKQGERSAAVTVSYIIQKNLGCFGDGGATPAGHSAAGPDRSSAVKASSKIFLTCASVAALGLLSHSRAASMALLANPAICFVY